QSLPPRSLSLRSLWARLSVRTASVLLRTVRALWSLSAGLLPALLHDRRRVLLALNARGAKASPCPLPGLLLSATCVWPHTSSLLSLSPHDRRGDRDPRLDPDI